MELPTEEQWKKRIDHGLRIAEYARCIAIAGSDLLGACKYTDEFVSVYYDMVRHDVIVKLLLPDCKTKEVLRIRSDHINFFNPYPIEWCKHIVKLGKAAKLSLEAEAKAKEEKEQREMLTLWGFIQEDQNE